MVDDKRYTFLFNIARTFIISKTEKHHYRVVTSSLSSNIIIEYTWTDNRLQTTYRYSVVSDIWRCLLQTIDKNNNNVVLCCSQINVRPDGYETVIHSERLKRFCDALTQVGKTFMSREEQNKQLSLNRTSTTISLLMMKTSREILHCKASITMAMRILCYVSPRHRRYGEYITS